MARQSSAAEPMSRAEVSSEFTSYYLERATKEFAEDLDKVRGADDFKNDAVSMLVRSLQQGTAMFSPEDQRRIVAADRVTTGGSRSDEAGTKSK